MPMRVEAGDTGVPLTVGRRSFDRHDELEMKRMYVEEMMSLTSISAHFKTTNSVIKFYLRRRLGVTLRDRTPSVGQYAKPRMAERRTFAAPDVASPSITRKLLLTGRASRRHLIRSLST